MTLFTIECQYTSIDPFNVFIICNDDDSHNTEQCKYYQKIAQQQ